MPGLTLTASKSFAREVLEIWLLFLFLDYEKFKDQNLRRI